MRRTTLRTALPLTAAALVVLLAVPAVASMRSATPDAQEHGAFQPVDHATTAFTYDQGLVSRGATATVEAFYLDAGRPDGFRSAVTLEVRGLVPFRTYGAHAHVGTCTGVPGGAGGHWAFPGSTAATLEDREIWLDITTDEQGDAKSVAVRTDAVPPTGRPMSVVIHANPTNVTTGGAGARLACLTVAF